MVRVSKDHLRAGPADLLDRHPLDASEGPDGHERRHLDLAVRRGKRPATSFAVGVLVMESVVEQESLRSSG